MHPEAHVQEITREIDLFLRFFRLDLKDTPAL